jgi:hypothetical protein
MRWIGTLVGVRLKNRSSRLVDRMVIERVVMVPPAAPGSKGDQGMLRGALSLLEGFPVRIVNPDSGRNWTSVLGDVGREPEGLTETQMPIRDYASELRGGDLFLVIGADVVDGTCELEPALSRIDLMMAEAALRGLPVFATCLFKSYGDRCIIQRLRLLPEICLLIRDVHLPENFQRLKGLAAKYYPDLSSFPGAVPWSLSDETGKAFGALGHRLLHASRGGYRIARPTSQLRRRFQRRKYLQAGQDAHRFVC